MLTRGSFSAQTTSSQDFGPVILGESPTVIGITFQFTGLSATPSFALSFGRDFSAAAVPSCAGTNPMTCSVQITFSPRSPGLKQDAAIAKDTTGSVLAISFLYGTGLAPQAVIAPGIIQTFAGTGVWDYTGDGSSATTATFRNPQGVAVDSAGNVYVADSVNQVVRKIDANTGLIITVAGNGRYGFSGDGGPATNAELNTPTGVALNAAGDLYIADSANNRIRKVAAATSIITTVAGGGTQASGSDGLGDGGPAISAILYGPVDVVVDTVGNFYIADCFNNLVRNVVASTGMINVFAGGGTTYGSDGIGDGGQAIEATLSNPSSVALDPVGDLLIADTGNERVRMVSAGGLITAIAGNGNAG